MRGRYAQTTKDDKLTAIWQRMGDVMIAKCAEALALRKAFPHELSGLYTGDELAQAAKADRDDTPTTTVHRARITAVDEETKPGRSGKGQFTKATITLSTGEQVMTLTDAIRHSAHVCKADGIDVVITSKPTRWGQEIVTLDRDDVAAPLADASPF